MKGLNKVFNDFEKVRSKFLEISPGESKELNNIINSFMQIFENLIYEQSRGNTKRYSEMKEDVPIESVLVVLDEIMRNLNSMNEEEMDNALGVLGAKLEHIKWDVDSALKSVNRLQSKAVKRSK